MRDVLIKSIDLGYKNSSVISEIKGNPSRIEIFNLNGESLISIDISVSNPLGTGRIQKQNLILRWELDESVFKDQTLAILDIPEESVLIRKINRDKPNKTTNNELKSYIDCNLIHIRPEKGVKAVVEFHDQRGQLTGPRIHIHKCIAGD